MKRRSFLTSALAAPLALIAGRAVSAEQHAVLIAQSERPLGVGPSPLGTPMLVEEQCQVVGTFAEPAAEVYTQIIPYQKVGESYWATDFSGVRAGERVLVRDMLTGEEEYAVVTEITSQSF